MSIINDFYLDNYMCRYKFSTKCKVPSIINCSHLTNTNYITNTYLYNKYIFIYVYK